MARLYYIAVLYCSTTLHVRSIWAAKTSASLSVSGPHVQHHPKHIPHNHHSRAKQSSPPSPEPKPFSSSPAHTSPLSTHPHSQHANVSRHPSYIYIYIYIYTYVRMYVCTYVRTEYTPTSSRGSVALLRANVAYTFTSLVWPRGSTGCLALRFCAGLGKAW